MPLCLLVPRIDLISWLSLGVVPNSCLGLWRELIHAPHATKLRSFVLSILIFSLSSDAQASFETEPNDSDSTADNISLNEQIEGSLSSSTDTDIFKIEISDFEEDQKVFNVDIAKREFDNAYIIYRIYDAKTQLGGGFVRGKSSKRTSVGLSTGGNYYIAITGADDFYSWSTSLDPYTVKVSGNSTGLLLETEPNNQVEKATYLPSETLIKGHTYSKEDIDFYVLEAKPDSLLHLNIDRLSRDFLTTEFELTSQDGYVLTSGELYDDESFSRTIGIGDGGTLYLKVFAPLVGFGDYEITAEYTDISDRDADGIPAYQDNCPTETNATQADMDSDGIGDACDEDRDGDGQHNTLDMFPDDSLEMFDADNDGLGDNSDPAYDPESEIDLSLVNRMDACSTGANLVFELDGLKSMTIKPGEHIRSPVSVGEHILKIFKDGELVSARRRTFDETKIYAGWGCDWSNFVLENSQTIVDSDGDLVADSFDAFPDDPAAFLDTDGDGYPDSWSNTARGRINTSDLRLDVFPSDPDEWDDTDNDGIGNNADTDDDGDGYSDEVELSMGSDPLDPSSVPEEEQSGLPPWLMYLISKP